MQQRQETKPAVEVLPLSMLIACSGQQWGVITKLLGKRCPH